MREFLLDCPDCSVVLSIVVASKEPAPIVFPCCRRSIPTPLKAKVRSVEVPVHLSARAWFAVRQDDELLHQLSVTPLPQHLKLKLRALGGVQANGHVHFPMRFQTSPEDVTPEEVAAVWDGLLSGNGALRDLLVSLPERWGFEGERLIAATRQLLSLPEHAVLVRSAGGELDDLLRIPESLRLLLRGEVPTLTQPKVVRTLLRALSPIGPLYLRPNVTRKLGNELRDQVREVWNQTRRQHFTGPSPGRGKLGQALESAGFTSWRSPEQRQAAEIVLGRRDGVVVLPTGSGKTLCYTLPAQLLADIDEGYVLVVSPLLALMADQVRREEGAVRFQGAMSSAEWKEAFGKLDNTHLVYVSPELLLSERFREQLISWRHPARIVIDEAHCVLNWGHTFRKDYLRLGEMRKWLEFHARRTIPLIAFSATLTPDDVSELLEHLQLKDPIVVSGNADRPELFYATKEVYSKKDRLAWLSKFLYERPVTRGLIYVSFAKGENTLSSSQVTQYLKRAGFSAACFHSGVPEARKSVVVDGLRSGELQVVVATSAFGMGVDLPWLDWVVHLTPPTQLSAYLQGAGRAGRNMDPSVEQALCVLLGCRADAADLSQHLYGSLPRADTIQQISNEMIRKIRKKGFYSWEAERGLLFINPQRDVARAGALAYAARRGGVIRRRDVERTLETPDRVYELPVDPDRMRVFDINREDDRRRVDVSWQAVLNYLSGASCLRETLMREFGTIGVTTAQFCCTFCDPEGGSVSSGRLGGLG